MVRPTGVTVIAVLCFIGTAFCALLGLLMMVGGGFMATIMSQQGQGSAGAAGILGALGAAVGVFFFVIAAIDGIVGWGLLKLKEWARIVMIVLSGIGAAFQALGVLRSLANLKPGSVVTSVIVIAIDAFIIFYLLKPEVKAAFQGPQARAVHA
jgi:hypothetical protein